MGLRNSFRNYLIRRLDTKGLMNDYINSTIRWNTKLVNDDSVLKSSDVNELMNDISTQIALAKPVLKDSEGNKIKHGYALDLLNHPNDYLTATEFMQLQTNALLLHGEVFPVYDGESLHLLDNIYSYLDDNLVEHYSLNGNELPSSLVEHVKKMGVRFDQGTGILDLAKSTLEGVMNAEETLTDKYKKGGLLAFLLKIDTVLNPGNKMQGEVIKHITSQLDDVSNKSVTKMIPLGKGYNVETLESPVEDDKVLNYLNVYKPDLGKFFGINVDTYQKLMVSDVEKAMMYLHNKTVKPILQNLAEHYTHLLLNGTGLHVEFELNTLDFVNYSTKTTIAYNNVRTGIWSPNDASEILGAPRSDDPLADERYISRDLVPLKDLPDVVKASLKGGDINDSTGNTKL